MRRLERPFAEQTIAATTVRDSEREDLDLAERERERLDQEGEQDDRRNQEDRNLSARGERDLGGELDLAAGRDDDRAAVLGRVPDDGHDHRRDEELREPHLLGEHLERADEDLGDERRHHRCGGEDEERGAERPPLDLLVARDVQRRVAAERVEGEPDVGDEEHDRDPDREVGERAPVGIALPARNGDDEKHHRRKRDEPEREEARPAVDLAPPAEEEREPEHEEQVPDHRAAQ